MKKSVLWRSVLVLALCIAGTANGMAQDLKSILSGVANAVANKVTGESASLTGTMWVRTVSLRVTICWLRLAVKWLPNR